MAALSHWSRFAWPCADLAALVLFISPQLAAQGIHEAGPRIARVTGTDSIVPAEDVWLRLDSLRQALEGFDRARAGELEANYERSGDPEKRLLERRFGTIEHRFRVSADPRGIGSRWEKLLEPGEGTDPGSLAGFLEEIVEGQYAAYYFFDGVIRPNVFARDAHRDRRESALHEKIHVIQPSIYRALGIRCVWIDPRDACVRSLEPVAVYLTEYAMLKRASPQRSDASVNRAIAKYLDQEARRCDYPRPVARCPAALQVTEYILLPRKLSDDVARHGLEDGMRRFIAGLAPGPTIVLTR